MIYIGLIVGATICAAAILAGHAVDEKRKRIDELEREVKRNSASMSYWAGRVLTLETELEKIGKDEKK